MAKIQKVFIKPRSLGSGATKSKRAIKKSNADGYAKRQSKKAKKLSSSTPDVYEYTSETTRRENVTLDLDRDEAYEYNVGTDGENDHPRDLRARLVGEDGENKAIESGEDEEIDSDEAFEESDEDRFAGFFSDKRKRPPRKRKSTVNFSKVDLKEDESAESEAEESGEDGDFLDALDILDGRGELDQKSDNDRASQREAVDQETDEEDLDEQGSSDGNEDERVAEQESEVEKEFEVSASDSEDAGTAALADLQNFVTGLDSGKKKRKAAEDDTLDSNDRVRKQRRLPLKEQTEAGPENEFHARTSSSKLELDDLLAPLASQSSALQSLRQSTKVLRSSSSKVKTLSAPLPQRAQERLDREAAYEQTKEEVDKWSGTIKRIREAEHISFPLQAPTAGRVSNMQLAAKFKPTTGLETSVDALLKSAKLREEDIQQTEETMLKANNVSAEEVAQRRMELRKMRELMFRAEIKAKRTNKIKSKTYRKLRRKERERLGENIADEEEEVKGEEERLKREVESAKERATLRHKHTGKWAKKMRGKEGVGEEEREAIEEMLERGERLRRKIKGVSSDDESDEDEESDDTDGDVDRVNQNAFDELKRVELEDDALRMEASEKNGKGIFQMKFMKDAMTRQQQATDELVREFTNDMEGRLLGGEISEADETETPDVLSMTTSQRTGGRVSYHPTDATQARSTTTRPIQSLPSDTSSVTLKSTDPLSPPQSPVEFHITPSLSNVPSNPWLTPRTSDSQHVKAPRKNNEIVVSKNSSAVSKSRNKIKKLAAKGAEEKLKALDDAVVEISTDKVLKLASTPAQSAQPTTSDPIAELPRKPVSASIENGDNGDDDDDNLEILEQEAAMMSKQGHQTALPRAFEQRDLVALAFAGDNVVQAFEEAKQREIAADAPREVDTTIPGWGAWGGAGIRKIPPKPQRIKKIAGIDPSTRADYKKAHVIISEKRDKKAAKYLVKDLPYPYTSKAQFEKTMERPLGTEWNTRVAFQKGTLPRVTKKPGMIIDPLEKLS